MKGLLDVGIRGFISLMEPNETNHQGHQFSSYQEQLYRLAVERDVALTCLRLPIPDQCVPTRQTMSPILDAIDALFENNTPTYIHCWGGKGRTGMGQAHKCDYNRRTAIPTNQRKLVRACVGIMTTRRTGGANMTQIDDGDTKY